MGGTFDPMHEGHILLCKTALKKLNLDRIWCIMTPQNPLKMRAPTALDARLRKASHMISHPSFDIIPSTYFTQSPFVIDMIGILQKRFAHYHFVWLMGADNLKQFHRWHAWQRIIKAIPISIFARPNIHGHPCYAPAAKSYKFAYYPTSQHTKIAYAKAPAWCYINMPLCQISSTALRAKKTIKYYAQRNYINNVI